MLKKSSKVLALSLASMLVITSFAGCKKKDDGTAAVNTPNGNAKAYNELAAEVSDTSDLPTWTGKQLTLKYWQGHGTGGTRKYTKMSNDVVTPEIKRVTGITLDEENSYDNGSGQSFDQKLALVVAANDYPEIVLNPGNLKTLVEKNLVYDLTDLIAKNCPNIMKKIPQSLKGVWSTDNRVSLNGKTYAVPTMMSEWGLGDLDKTLDVTKYSRFFPPIDGYYSIAVRDDILKQLYPNAKSQKEIEDQFVKNGKFTKEDIFDVPIKSKEDFFKMLYDIKKLNVKEGNQEVYPLFLNQGGDNWNLFVGLAPALYGVPVLRNSSNPYTYFTYYDKQTKKFDYTFKTPEFKSMVKDLNKLTQDKVASPEAFLDSTQIITEKANKGLFAVLYPYDGSFNVTNVNSQLEKAGKDYRYRKVYLNIKPDTNKYPTFFNIVQQNLSVAIFKNKVKEEDVAQVLRYIDYMVSDSGEKLLAWGPKSAGLFDEVNGKRTFKDKDLENYMVYNKSSDKALSYNLPNGLDQKGTLPNGGTVPTYIRNYYSKYAPAVTYDTVKTTSDVNTYFKAGLVEPVKYVQTLIPGIYTENATVPDADKAWKARTSFEDALEKVLASQSDAQFEQTFKDFLANSEKIGYTDKVLSDIWEAFKKRNADYMSAFN